MRHVLVVANKTLGGDELVKVLMQRAEVEPTEFWIVVPATPLPAGRPESMTAWAKGIPVGSGGTSVADDDRAAREAAEERLRLGIERLRRAGATVDGQVGSRDPQQAVRYALSHRQVDEIIVSTLPSGVSHWLRLDLRKRLERKHHVPVTTVTAQFAHR
jgi:GABA permease